MMKISLRSDEFVRPLLNNYLMLNLFVEFDYYNQMVMVVMFLDVILTFSLFFQINKQEFDRFHLMLIVSHQLKDTIKLIKVNL